MNIVQYLKELGLDEESEKIKSRWLEVSSFWDNPQPEYQYAYANELLENIAKLTLHGLRKTGISIVTKQSLETETDECNIRYTLNEAWMNFWENTDFRRWEENALKKLRESLK